MISIDTSLLETVRGGVDDDNMPSMNVERIHTPHINVDRVLTNYGYCASTVEQACNNASGVFGKWTGAAARCTLDNLKKQCGEPTWKSP